VREYFYVRTYKCKNGNHPVLWLATANQADVPDSYFTAAAMQAETWCDYPGCDWHGIVGKLQFVRSVQCLWIT